MMGRRKKVDILKFVFQCALQDRVTLLDAVRGCSKAEQDAVHADIKSFRKLYREIFGDDNQPDPTDGMIEKDFLETMKEIFNQFETDGEGVVDYSRPKQPKQDNEGNNG
jgi:hypothetical protein